MFVGQRKTDSVYVGKLPYESTINQCNDPHLTYKSVYFIVLHPQSFCLGPTRRTEAGNL